LDVRERSRYYSEAQPGSFKGEGLRTEEEEQKKGTATKEERLSPEAISFVEVG